MLGCERSHARMPEKDSIMDGRSKGSLVNFLDVEKYGLTRIQTGKKSRKYFAGHVGWGVDGDVSLTIMNRHTSV